MALPTAHRAGVGLAAVALLCLVGCDYSQYADPSRRLAAPPASDRVFPTVVHEPTSFGVLDAPLVLNAERDIPAGTACETCHDEKPDPSWDPERDELFHTNVETTHGNLSCNQCHDQDRRVLHLADGSPVPFLEVIRLCGQCHGTQYRDFTHGAHGGMNGYWDTRQGARLRNNCVDCHTPHAPAFGTRLPVFPPRDRYLLGAHAATGEHHEPAGTHEPTEASHE
jgi:hypothetical protein